MSSESSGEMASFVLGMIPDGIIVVNTDGEIIFANKHLGTMLGYQIDEILGKKVEVIIPERFRSGHVQLRKSYEVNPTVRSMGKALGIVAKHKNGQEISVDINLSPQTWQGRLVTLAILRNIDHIKLLETKLREANSELELNVIKLSKLNKDKNGLLGMAAHDLRNPIGSISSMSRIVLEDSDIEDEMRGFVQRIHDVSMFTLTLLSDILDVSALESGTVSLKLAPLDIKERITKGLELWRPMGLRKGIVIKESWPLNLPKILADQNKFYQFIDNLMTNAIKYSRKDSEVTLTVSVTPLGYVRIEIKDQGPGIPEEAQPHLFDAFYTTGNKPTGGEASIGLGLAIVKKAVEAHQGKVWVESQPGSGAIFIVELPVISSDK